MTDLDVIDLDDPALTVPDSPATLVAIDEPGPVLVTPLSRDEAEQLTNQIRSASEVLWVLLLRAHEGRAWEALGYARWLDYVKAEFDLSRSHAYRLLDAARMERALTAALPEGATVRISEKAARDLKEIASEVIGDVAERTAGMAPDLAGELAAEVIEDHRARARAQQKTQQDERRDAARDRVGRGEGTSSSGGGVGFDYPGDADDYDDAAVAPIDQEALRRATTAAYDAVHSINALSSMPSVEEVIAAIPVERRFQLASSIPTAVAWFNDFYAAWCTAQAAWQDERLDTAAGL